MFLNQKDAWLRAAHNPETDDQPPPIDEGLFMAEGVLVVEHLLDSEYPVEAVLVSLSRAESVMPLIQRMPASVPVYIAEQTVMDEIVGFPIHRGLLACGRRLPNPDPLALAERSRALIVLEDLSNHDNVGSVFRSAAALGGTGVGVLLSRRCCDPLYRKALRVSMGHALRIPYAVADDLPALMGDLEAMGYTTLALTPGPGSMTLDESLESDIRRPVLCLGAEGPGLSDALLAASRQRVKIPMAGGVDSLNIAVAAAICMHRYLIPS